MGFLKDIQVDLNAEAMTLYNECHDSLLVEAVDLCKDAHAAEDLVMRTFEEFCKNREKYDPEKGSWLQWLKGIMRNIHHNASRGKAISCMVYMSPEELALVQDSSESETGAIDAVLANSDAEVVRRAINGLSKEMREVILLKYFEDLPIAQIAKILNASEDSIKCRLYYARKILAKRLGKQLGKKPVAIVVALLLSVATAFGAWKAADALGWLERAKDETAEVVEVQQPSEPAAATCETTEPAASESPHSAPDLETGKDEPSTKDLTTEKGESKMSIKTAVCACATGVALGTSAVEPNASLSADSYVRRGLIYQWDGADGLTEMTWTDRIRGEVLTKQNTVTLEEGGACFNGGSWFQGATVIPATSITSWSAEVHFKVNTLRSADNHIIGTNGSGGWSFLQASGHKFSFVPRYNSAYKWIGETKTLEAGEVLTSCAISEPTSATFYRGDCDAVTLTGLTKPDNGSQKFRIGSSGSSSSGFNGWIYAVRIYDRALTANEVLLNANIDKVRFQSADPESLTWPEDYRYSDGKLQCRVRIMGDELGGTVSVAGGPPMAGVSEAWVAADDAAVSVVAVPADGYVFCRWTGDTEDLAFDQYRSPSISVVGGVRTLRAEFRVVGTNVHTVPGDFNSLAAALSSPLVKDGDTIQLADGTHAFAQEATVGDYTYLAAIDRFVTVRGSSPDKVVLDCGGAGGLYINHPAALVEGVTIQNFQRTSSTFALEFFNGVVSNVCISGSSGKCMYVKGSIPAIRAYEGALFEDCMITNINKQNWDTSSIASANGTIFRRTTFYGNKAYNGILSVAARSGVRTRLEDCAFAMNSDYYRPMISGSDVDVVDSVFYGNSNSDAGAGLNLSGVCTFDRCVVTNNTLNGSSPLVICNASSKVFATNCLFAANKIANWGAFKLDGKDVRLELVNCTVAANKTTSSTYCGGITGDGASGAKATVRLLNTVFWSNTANGVVKNFLDSYLYTDFDFDNSCFTGIVPTSGAGNTAVDPVFVDAAGGDFRLGENSSCIDTGADASAVVVDLDGTERPIDGTGGTNPKWDIGCYETIAREIPVQCSLKVLGDEGVWPCPMTQTVTVVGSRLTGLSYEWLAIRTEGHVPVTNRQVTAVAENVFEGLPVGVYSFVCTVSNDRGDTASSRIDDAFMMFAGTCYVSNDGSDTFPYTNAAMAARNLSTVIPLAGERIVIEPGEYKFGHYVDEQTGYDTMGAVYRAVAIEAGETAEDVILDCSGCGGLILANAGASLHGVTFRNYRTSVVAPVLYLKSGTVSNIVVSGDNVALKGGECVYVGELTELENLVVTNHRASAITVAGGTLRKALIFGCHSGSSSVVSTTQSSHGIGSTLEDVKISGCSTDSAAILALGSCNASRCTVVGNTNVNKNANCVSLGSSRLSDSRVVRNSAQCAVAVTTEWMDSYDVWMRNCLVAENKTSSRAAVAVPTTSRQYLLLENCTIIGNAAETAPAGGTLLVSSSYVNHLKMVNCIIWGNTTGSEPADIAPGGDDFIYQNCCFREAEEEAYVTSKSCKDNLACDAGVKRNGKLMQLSPCRDAGQMLSWHVGGHDIDGNPRVCDVEKGGRVDIGCYENPLGRGFCILVR